MGAKIQIKNDSIHNFGGFFFCIDHFRKAGLADVIDNTLGIRGIFATYSYSEIVETLMSIYLTGGSRIEDAKRLSAQFSEKTQGYEMCSPDTILKMLSDKASEDTFLDTGEGKSYKFNINGRLDRLLIDGLLKCGQVRAGGGHTFDYDNQFIPTEKYDSKYSYKKAFGYFPGIAQVDGMPFYIEGRDGNANVRLGQAETLRRAFEAAEARGVTFDRARMDCGSYASDIVDVVSHHCRTFYIRAMMCGTLRDRIHAIPEEEWEETEINYQKCQLASLPFEAFFPERGYRLVVQRTLCDGQTDILDGQYVYRCILTNDNESGLREIVELYNQRAATERCFDCMNNDFGWACLPCSSMKANTVFMILTAFIHNFYRYFLGLVAGAAFGLKATSRVKRFVFSFVSVPFKWVKCGARKMLRLYTNNDAYLRLRV